MSHCSSMATKCFHESSLPTSHELLPRVSPIKGLYRSATTCQSASDFSMYNSTPNRNGAGASKNSNYYFPAQINNRPVSASNLDHMYIHSNDNTLPDRPTSMISYPMNSPNYIPFVNDSSYNNVNNIGNSNTLTRNHRGQPRSNNSCYYRDQSDCVTLTPTNDTNTCQVTGYMSESGELAPTPPARATLSPASVAPLRYHQHSQQTTRVFKDGISAIRDCLQRSDIQLADSDRYAASCL